MLLSAARVALAGLVLITGAGPAHGRHHDPLSLSVSPAKVLAARGEHRASLRISVANDGTRPVTVRTTLADVGQRGAQCAATGSAPPWASVSPAGRFRLAPGAHRAELLTLDAPASVTGPHDVAAIFTAAVRGSHGTAVFSGAVGSQLELRLSGPVQERPCALAGLPAKAAGSSWAALASGLSALAVLTVAVWLADRRRRRRPGPRHRPRGRHLA